jgi:hypothetical protein
LWELKKISSGDALLNFEVRHEFETLALRYCAGPECSDEMREALIEHFDWKNDGQHMRSLDNWAAHIVVARCRAAWSLEMFSNELANRPLLKLLQDRTAPELAGRLKDATFTRHLLRLITVVRAHHPEMLAYKLEPGVVEWWYQRANAKRYFVDTAKQSFFAGLGLFALYFALCTWLLPQREPYLDFAALVLGQAVAFGVGALLAFRFPDLIPGLKASTAHHTATLLALRYRSAVQFGWLPPLLLLFLLVFTESPTPLLASCVRVGMALAMAAALFAMSPGLTLAGAGLVVLVGAFFAALMVSALFSGFGLPAFICGGIALAVQYLRGGESLYAFSGLPLSHLTRLRLAWLAGAAGVIYFALTAFLLERQLAAIVFTWAFFGILLSRPRFALWNFPVLVILSIGLDLMERAGTYKIGDARLRLMLLMLEYVAFTMLLNMWRARTTKQYFS